MEPTPQFTDGFLQALVEIIALLERENTDDISEAA